MPTKLKRTGRRLRRNPGEFSLTSESVADQKTRQAREVFLAKRKADTAKLEELRRRSLVGSRGSIGQKDLFGGGDLFSNPMKKRRRLLKNRAGASNPNPGPKGKKKRKAAKPASKIIRTDVKSTTIVRKNPRKRRALPKAKRRTARPAKRRPAAKQRRQASACSFVAIPAGGKIQLCRVQDSRLHKLGTFTAKTLRAYCGRHGIKMR